MSCNSLPYYTILLQDVQALWKFIVYIMALSLCQLFPSFNCQYIHIMSCFYYCHVCVLVGYLYVCQISYQLAALILWGLQKALYSRSKIWPSIRNPIALCCLSLLSLYTSIYARCRNKAWWLEYITAVIDFDENENNCALLNGDIRKTSHSKQ